MKDKIWLSSPHMGGNEQKYVKEAFDENWIAPLGPNVNGLEQELASYLEVEEVAALNSGTGAIHLSLTIAGVQAGDYVLCSTFTFCATANPIKYLNAHPVFIDSEEQTWNCDPVLLEKAIVELMAEGKKPKAFVLVHLYGMPSLMDEIVAVCTKYEVALIEDAAEALGSTYKGQKLGTFGDFGIFSFNGNKIITTSGGGALVSNNAKYIDRARFLSAQAKDESVAWFEHPEMGYNYRLSNILAALGCAQLEGLEERVKFRRDVFDNYKNLIINIVY